MPPALANCLASRGRTGQWFIIRIDVLLSVIMTCELGAYPDAPPGGSFWLSVT